MEVDLALAVRLILLLDTMVAPDIEVFVCRTVRVIRLAHAFDYKLVICWLHLSRAKLIFVEMLLISRKLGLWQAMMDFLLFATAFTNANSETTKD